MFCSRARVYWCAGVRRSARVYSSSACPTAPVFHQPQLPLTYNSSDCDRFGRFAQLRIGDSPWSRRWGSRARVRAFSSWAYRLLGLASDDGTVRFAVVALALLVLLGIGAAAGSDWRSSPGPELLEPAVELRPAGRTAPRKQVKRVRPKASSRRIKRRKTPGAAVPVRPHPVSTSVRVVSPRPATRPGRSSRTATGNKNDRRAAPARRPAPVVNRSDDEDRGASPVPIPPVPAGSDGDDDKGAGGGDEDRGASPVPIPPVPAGSGGDDDGGAGGDDDGADSADD
jgi:hypothetical protein